MLIDVIYNKDHSIIIGVHSDVHLEDNQFMDIINSLNWWNNLSSGFKTQLCDTNTELVGTIRRWETLTNKEVELMWKLIIKG